MKAQLREQYTSYFLLFGHYLYSVFKGLNKIIWKVTPDLNQQWDTSVGEKYEWKFYKKHETQVERAILHDLEGSINLSSIYNSL
jgi:hypothetical protein